MFAIVEYIFMINELTISLFNIFHLLCSIIHVQTQHLKFIFLNQKCNYFKINLSHFLITAPAYLKYCQHGIYCTNTSDNVKCRVM